MWVGNCKQRIFYAWPYKLIFTIVNKAFVSVSAAISTQVDLEFFQASTVGCILRNFGGRDEKMK
jgi:hypothetical protein